MPDAIPAEYRDPCLLPWQTVVEDAETYQDRISQLSSPCLRWRPPATNHLIYRQKLDKEEQAGSGDILTRLNRQVCPFLASFLIFSTLRRVLYEPSCFTKENIEKKGD